VYTIVLKENQTTVSFLPRYVQSFTKLFEAYIKGGRGLK